jgi:excisionase family DNA binding protein
MSLIGLTKEQLEKELDGKSRPELVQIIYSLASFPPMISPAEVARRCELDPRTVLKLIRQGRIREHKVGHRTVRIPLEALNEWDERTRVCK